MARTDLHATSSLPPKVQGFIGTRLSRLAQPAREIVHLAATIGRDFSFEVLREAGDLEEKALVKALDELWGNRVVREKGTSLLPLFTALRNLRP
jgi:predicted ATPase